MNQSLVQQAIQTPEDQAILMSMMEKTDISEDEFLYDWELFARPNQLPPKKDWLYWLLLAGRGFGKTRAGAEWIRNQVEDHGKRRIALVGATAADVRDIMVEGDSGLLAVSPPWNCPVYIPSKTKLIWPNGAVAHTYSAEKPDRLRGPQHDCAWADELASWQRMQDTWDMLMFGLRIGDKPQCVVTATPRPLNLIKELVKDKDTVITSGDTFENRANLAPAFFNRIIQKYRGTRLGRQEIYAEILDDNPEALFNRDIIDKYRVDYAPELKLISVGVDPAVTSNENSNDTGIIVAGKDKKNHYYVLYDYTCHTSPERWARKCVNAYNDHQANRIVPEVNNGGDMVRALMKTIDPSVRVKSVRATRGKALRAEPISALYEQGRVHHVGIFPKLEDQMCQWDPGLNEDSPDRLDAAVWALTDLSKTAGGKTSGY